MIYVCIICTGRKPSLSSLSGEHRQILEAIMSPTINLAQLKCFPLWTCASCQALINAVESFRNKALAGASHLLSRLALVQVQQDTHLQPEDSPLLPVKQDPDDLLEAKSFVKFEIDVEKLKPQELEGDVKTECFDSDDNHSETSDPLTSPQGHLGQGSLPTLLETAKVSDLFLCRICGQRVPTSQTDAHTALHTPPYCCYGCSYETSDKSDIVRHHCDGVVIERSGMKSREEEKRAKTKGPASRVTRIKGPRPPKEFRCSECYLRFADEAYLARHIQKYQQETQGQHVCEWCKREFKSQCRLKIHVGGHRRKESESVDTIKPELFCAECGIQFQAKSSFRSHMKTLKHTPRDKWKFKCDTCEKLYFKKHELKIHINSIHLKKSDHQCPQCHKVFWRGHVLRKHVESVHEGKAKPRPYVCHVCGATFIEIKTLKEHILTHSDVRPHACPLCPATFKFKAALFTHNRLKHLKIKGNWKKPAKGKEKKKKKKVDAESLGNAIESQIGSS